MLRRLGRQRGKRRFGFFGLGIVPRLPQAVEEERPMVMEVNVIRLLARGCGLPLVVPARPGDASTSLERFLEHRLFMTGLSYLEN